MRQPSSMLLLLLLAAGGPARADGGALCQDGGARVTAARASLAASRESLPARFELADALVEASCYHDAVHTLEEGAALHPRNADLIARLRTTRSLVTEQDYFEGREQAELAARLSRNLLRCTRLADVDACDEALKLKPDDAQIQLAKADALLKASRPGEAESAYRRARELAPGDARIATRLAAARAQRQPLRERCLGGADDAALQACEVALSKGADDEREIAARIAALSRPARPESSPQYARPVQPGPVAAPDVAAVAPIVARTFTNAAEPGRSH